MKDVYEVRGIGRLVDDFQRICEKIIQDRCRLFTECTIDVVGFGPSAYTLLLLGPEASL